MADLWVFGYGSLMWRPGFAYDEAAPALLVGAHRALCVYSIFHRGSPAKPGLVLGLDAGGRCRGMAFRVNGNEARTVRSYLRAREQVTLVYREAMRPVHLLDGSRRGVRALCFLVDRLHPQYAGNLPVALQADIVRHGRGRAGDNVDYVARTVSHLEELGIYDPPLERLLARLGPRARNGAAAARGSPPAGARRFSGG